MWSADRSPIADNNTTVDRSGATVVQAIRIWCGVKRCCSDTHGVQCIGCKRLAWCKLAGSATLLVFTLSLVLVYFVLAAQYENWITPLAVLLAVPLAVLGTVLALKATGVPNNIYVQIGLVLLIALSAKNAILVVEMARKCHAEGASIPDAAIQAARARFRPVMMTSLTFILGVLPLLLSSGAGASARKCLGLAVASGMLASTCLAIVFVPSFFVVRSPTFVGRGW
jgi:HAE1 family hydrophobic/amphiphilic exporter-1